jgi:hypothetical protein
MKRLGYSPAALVLGPLAERALRQSLIISDAGVLILFQRPISAVLTTLALLAVSIPVMREARRWLCGGAARRCRPDVGGKPVAPCGAGRTRYAIVPASRPR